MNRALFWTGATICGSVLAAMATDFAAHAAPRREPVLPTPEGFAMKLDQLGPLEVAFAGRVRLVTDRREEEEGGGARRVPRWKVAGDDPSPDGAGMEIRDTRIESLAGGTDAAQGPPLIADAPRAWIALERDRGLLTIDLDRPWRLFDPVLDLPGFRPGSRMEASARGMTVLKPREGLVSARGPFRLEAENLSLDAAGFEYDANTGRVGFEPWQGVVSWRFTDERGRVLSGSSDAGGEVTPDETGGLTLRFHEGARGVTAALPVGADLPAAIVLARALAWEFAADAAGAWRPLRAHARGPTTFSDRRLAFEGGDAELEWDAAGGLREARVTGPIAAHPWEPPLHSAVARRGARYDALTGALHLDGRAWAGSAEGALSGDALVWDGAQLDARGGVVAQAPAGTATAAHASAAERDGVAAEGAVRLVPASGPVDELRGPELRLDPGGDAVMPAGFEAEGRRDAAVWTLTGDRLTSRVDSAGERRADAAGNLVYLEAGIRIEAERFLQTAADRFRLEGAPARAELLLGSGRIARARFRRAESDPLRLRLEGEPWLQWPAAEFGLAGEAVELTARAAERRHEDGAWTLEGPLHATGALRAEADLARWSPAEGLTLERRLRPLEAEGTLADGTAFWGRAEEFGITAEREVRLSGDAEGRVQTPDGKSHRFWADRIRATEFGGSAEGKASVDSPLGKGRGDFAEWRLREGELDWLRATGSARLERDDLTAEGDRIEADLTSGWVEAEGTPERPAWLTRPDGGEVRAVWLRYNLRTHLLESGPIRLATPEAPR